MSYVGKLRKKLFGVIDAVCTQREKYFVSSKKDFTRRGKFMPQDIFKSLLLMESKSLSHELLPYFNFKKETPTPSAFVQARAKIKPEGFETVFDRFVSETTDNNAKYLYAVVDFLYVTTESIYEKQACSDKNCAVRKVDNPAWLECGRHMGEAAKIINGKAPGDVDQARIDYENWSAARDAYPRYVDEAYCPMEHTNHSIALTFYDKNSVLMRLGISDDKYAQWVGLTIKAFEKLENNEMIP